MKEFEFTSPQEIALMTDFWTSISNESFIAVTVHYIDNSYVLRRICLGVLRFVGSHTGEAIVDQLIKLKNDWKIHQFVIITDNATNMTKATALLGKFFQKYRI